MLGIVKHMAEVLLSHFNPDTQARVKISKQGVSLFDLGVFSHIIQIEACPNINPKILGHL